MHGEGELCEKGELYEGGTLGEREGHWEGAWGLGKCMIVLYWPDLAGNIR